MIFQCDATVPCLPTFPLILGRKPTLESAQGNTSLEKENRPPDNVVAGLADTILSKVRSGEIQTLWKGSKLEM